jgi:hypothetical protein
MAHTGEVAESGSSTMTSSAAPLICRHAAERIGIDQPFGFRGQRAGEGSEIGLRQQCVELGHRVHRIRVSGTGARVGAGADNAHVERLGELRKPAAGLSEADDQQRLAAELVLSLREVADHTAPDPFCLIVARLRKPARERQHQRHDVLGDRGH